MDTFELLKEYIIDNAQKCEVYSLDEYLKGETFEIYKINRKPAKHEGICDAVMRKGSTEFYFAIEVWDDDNNPIVEAITINNINEPYIHQGITITKKYGKVTIE